MKNSIDEIDEIDVIDEIFDDELDSEVNTLPPSTIGVSDEVTNDILDLPVREKYFNNLHVNAYDQLVFAIGTLGYDFITEAKRDYFITAMNDHEIKNGKLYNFNSPLDQSLVFQAKKLSKFLLHGDNIESSNNLHWTINQNGIPIYVICPNGAFAQKQYYRLVEFLHDQNEDTQDDQKNDIRHDPSKLIKVGIQGKIVGMAKLFTGQTVPVIEPVLRGMTLWNSDALYGSIENNLLSEIKDRDPDLIKSDFLKLLNRIFCEMENDGTSSESRAINYVATNIHQMGQVFSLAIREGLQLSQISCVESDIKRDGIVMYDVDLVCFDPLDNRKARKTYRQTVDVSDISPVFVGGMREWYTDGHNL
ncbi:hypothetical protein [Vibrio sonorensis]|uniref:cyanobactin maturation protease PatG family protein n=1 Tax=Vibrio sonorensis TaxID=1004316 RepID=UPI0008DA256A|nr:hypothetical protein [Vibrio sonorensis]